MNHRQRGFTLLELMVVLMVVGLLLSMVNLATSDNAAQTDTEAFGKQLQAAVTQYRQEAVFQNLDLGLGWLPEEFWLLVYTDPNSREMAGNMSVEELTRLQKNPWLPYRSELSPVIEIPEEVYVRLIIDEEDIQLEDLFEEETGLLPALLFLASDEYTPFRMELTHDSDDRFMVILEGDGISPVMLETERPDEF